MFDFGWDAERGGGFVYRDALGKPCDKTDWMLKTWWADCPDFPEWYAYAPVDGRRCHTYKGNVRKGLFYLPRRLLDCLELLERK